MMLRPVVLPYVWVADLKFVTLGVEAALTYQPGFGRAREWVEAAKRGRLGDLPVAC